MNVTSKKKKKAVAKMTLMKTPLLDKCGKEYLRLLSDPCNAAFCSPPFQGEGTGQFVRTRTVVTPALVDSVIQFCPQYIFANSSYGGGTIASTFYQSPVTYGSANAGTAINVLTVPVASTSFGFNNVGSGTTTSGVYSSARCLAGCIKVMYTGSELNRAGTVYATLTNTPAYSALNANPGSLATITTTFPQVDRLGERHHEYRWVPNFQDEQFIPTPGSTTSVNFPAYYQGNSLIVAVMGAPTNSITYEVTAVWEVNTNPYSSTAGANNFSSGIVTTTKVPDTQNTLNDVLRVIGNIGKWALGPYSDTTAYMLGHISTGMGFKQGRNYG